MRLLWPYYFAVCTVLLHTRAESVTSSGMRTYAAARNLSSLPPFVAKTESVEPERSAQQDSMEDTVYGEHRQQDEARAGMWNSLVDARDVLGIKHVLEGQLHANTALTASAVEEKIDEVVTYARLHQRFSEADKPGHSFRNDDFIKKVRQSGQEKVMAKYFLWLRGTPLKSRAESVQRGILAECPEVSPLVFEVWLEAGVGPVDAYHMMNIPSGGSWKGAGGIESSLLASYHMLEKWMHYMELRRDRGLAYSIMEEAKVLQIGREPVDVVRFLTWLRSNQEMRKLASMMLRRLAKDDLDRGGNLQQLFDVWLDFNVNPKDVYPLMSMIRKSYFTKPTYANKKIISFNRLKRWLDYVDKYRLTNFDFGDDRVIDVLLDERQKVEVERFVEWLGEGHDMTDRAPLLQKELASRLPATP
ncbi:unnamed protein product [Hyaloperonospora brassicae]|uniref:RxLR effector candidate protein n=1 Tax=Hyaloperonospora brassicae TaxID=162125 RepID=A0AAV0UN99_HYABA|nr:unnamed protein product [Hyaloperonospora brassicae]